MSLEQWRVVVAEDEYDSLRMISKILEHHGIRAEIAHNGEECLALVQESTRTLVIVDLAMPRKDGWQTLAEIRGNPATRNLPVVAMTAYYALDVAEDAQRAGFDGFFPKPVSPKTFITSLEEILAGRCSRQLAYKPRGAQWAPPLFPLESQETDGARPSP